MRRIIMLLSTSFVLACQEAPKKDPPKTEPTPIQKTTETKPATAIVIAPPASTPASAATSTPASMATIVGSWLETPLPTRDPDNPDMMDHATLLGWSTDSSEFMYCGPVGGVSGEYCIYQEASTGKKKTITTTGKDDPDKTSATAEKEIKARQAKMGYAVSSAALSGASITWKEIPGSFDSDNPKAKLSVSVHSLDKKKEAAVANIELTGVSIHPEAIQVSPDGKYLVILAHSYMGEYSDTFGITIAPVENLQKLLK